ncbi:5-hydroxytryptamine receptor 2B-like [Hydractinia symbiolongicarpus]|uniref:5-hydroxytryptamine receptor 2B-like n=1 Tax=Hydractinia symbiolongicarpus TaxID=13093 RepID=UPI00254E352A|nr:5-hydroxytryptamine receptor 2B-like [Hydractinia symbiolongicarpus]
MLNFTSGNVSANTNLVNGTHDAVKNFTIVDVLGLFMLGLLVICIIGGNVLVIGAFIIVGRKIRTVTNYFVVSLAVSDILVGLFSVPFWMWVQIKSLPLSSAPHFVFVAFDIMCGVASIVNLTVISLERLFAVVRPASHRNLSRKTHLIVGATAFVWIFALVNSGLYFVKAFHNWTSYNVYIVLVGFVSPTVIIVGSYIGIYKVAQQHATEQRRLQQEMRLARMIAIVIALFVACWLPFFLLNILYVYCDAPTCRVAIMQKAIPFVKFLHYSNSMMNPIVYAYRNSDFREAFKSLLVSWFGRWKYRYMRSPSAKSCATLRSEFDEDYFPETLQRSDTICSDK